MELTLKTATIGKNGFLDIRTQLDAFVQNNFNLLYEGAVRLGLNRPSDYWAPRRIQINNTRLHAAQGLKYADGHKYCDPSAPTESQLRQTVKDIQALIDAASAEIPAPFVLNIVEV